MMVTNTPKLPLVPQGNRPGQTKPTQKTMGRPAGRSSDETRQTILDQAEALFADGGYDGSSIRDIAAKAGVQAAVIGYHFGSKDELFDAVVQRRISVLNAQRAQALAEALAAKGGRALKLEVLIRCYVAPFIEATSHGDAGWRNFATLMGRLANSPRGVDVIERHADGIARSFLREFERCLPDISQEALVDGFLYMVSAMLFVSAGTGRWERLLRRAGEMQRDAEAILENLIPFVAGGLTALRAATRS